MLKSNDIATNFVNRAINSELDKLDYYCKDLKTRKFLTFSDSDNLLSIFSESTANLSFDDLENLRRYTGFLNYKKTNQLLRGYWNYDENGPLTDEIANEYKAFSDSLSEIIKNNSYLPGDIKVYRGVSIEFFKKYGITSIEELSKLKDEYIYDAGFTSTSLVRENSFFGKKFGDTLYNIEIEYMIPSESSDGISLVGYDSSYYKEQETEYLIDKSALSKIIDVSFDGNGNALLKAVYIPKKVWDKDYYLNESFNK